MGIKNVNKTVKEKSSRAFFTEQIIVLKGKRLAIDSPLLFHANVSSLTKNYVLRMKDPLEDIEREKIIIPCLSRIMRFHTFWLEKDTTCIWIEDGKVSKEKQELARKKRKEKREGISDKIKALKEKLKALDPLLRNKADLDELRKLMCQYTYILPEEYQLFYNIIDGFGIPHIRAPGEAEAYACSLNAAGLVYGVWTTDTDCYALGGVNMVTEFADNNDETISVVHIPYILEDMKFSKKEMLDFCIMCGTDFNDNIPRVANVGAFKAISKYGSITKYKKEKDVDCDILNYKRTRELLTAPVCNLIHESPELKHNKESFNELARELSIQYNLGDYYAKMAYHHDRDIPCEMYFPGKEKIKIRIAEETSSEEKAIPSHEKKLEKKPGKLIIEGREENPTSKLYIEGRDEPQKGKLIIEESVPKKRVVVEELE